MCDPPTVFVFPQISDEAVIDINHFLEAFYTHFQNHYYPQIQRYYADRSPMPYGNDQLPLPLDDPPF